ncbi:MAG: hypothetical protein M3Y17_08580 [Actinomycetota bacterium]|nr:hypothetical protein [Actinomycetota bacterium]
MVRLRLIALIACAAALASLCLPASSLARTPDFTSRMPGASPPAGGAIKSADQAASASSAPSVTLTAPAQGAFVSDAQPVFAGFAGTAPGDSARINVALYRGSQVRGRPFGTASVARSGSTWSGRWPRVLRPGSYTARAQQGDDAGSTGYSAPHTFRIVSGTGPIGPGVSLGPGSVSVPITCPAPAPSAARPRGSAQADCTGTVMILTVGRFRPLHGGPVGRLLVLFAYFDIPGGQTQAVGRAVPGPVVRALRRAAPLRVDVTTILGQSGGRSRTVSGVRVLRTG